MEKQVLDFEIPFSFDWTYGVEISKIREDLDALEKLGATRIDIETSSFYDSLSVDIKAYVSREETDEEYKRRLEKETQRQNEIKLRELEMLERLKNKYNK